MVFGLILVLDFIVCGGIRLVLLFCYFGVLLFCVLGLGICLVFFWVCFACFLWVCEV